MSDVNRETGLPIFSGRAAQREEIVARFEEAWQRGEDPGIDSYLPEQGQEWQSLLVELVHVDLEWRLKAGKDARVEVYLKRFPGLTEDIVVELILAEYMLRKRTEPRQSVDQWLQRFPEYRDELIRSLPPESKLPQSAASPIRLNCPHCQNPIIVAFTSPEKETVCPCCKSTFRLEQAKPPSGPPENLIRLGKFELLEAVGRGSFGIVYRARDTDLDRIVAVKVPRTGVLVTKEDEDRFVREARSAAQLYHPGIVPIYEVGHSESFPYIVSQYVTGLTLSESLNRRRFVFRESAEMVAQLADALEHSHKQGVIHRDIKPSNIMLREENGQIFALLMDFGLARREEGEVTVTLDGQVIGTPAYMSPELAKGDSHRVDGRSDLYSLGVILYELLVGERPFRGNIRMLLHQVLNAEPQPPRKLNDRIDRDLETICLKCLQKEPGKRYLSAGELGEDLRRFLRGEPIHARPAGRREKAWRWSRRNPWLAALMAAVVILLLGITVVSLSAAITIAAARNKERQQRIEAQTARDQEAAQRQRAEGAERIAKAARSQSEVNEKEAQNQARTAAEVSRFLTALFETADPIQNLSQGGLKAPNEKGAVITAGVLVDRGVRRLKNELQDQPVVRAALLDTLGNVDRSLGLYDQAEPLLEDALRLRLEVLGPKHLDVASSWHNLAWLRHEQGRFAEAEALYRKALAVRRNVRGSDDLEVAYTMVHLAWAITFQLDRPDPARLEEAETLLREVVRIFRLRLPADHRNIDIAVLGLASVRLARTEPGPKQLLILLESQACLGQSTNKDFLSTTFFTCMKADTARQAGHFDESLQLYRQVYAKVCEVLGEEHVGAILLLGQQALVLRQKGDLAEAERVYRKAIDQARRSPLLRWHPVFVVGLLKGADYLREQGNTEEAEEVCREALVVARRIGNKDLIRKSLDKLIQLLRERNCDLEADALLQEKGAG